MKQLQTGDESTCQICGERIRWLVALWLHENLNPQPPHEAIPIKQEEKKEEIASVSSYERFTDRARKCMQLANQEAQRFNVEYLGTEHLLLGLVKEGSGIAANVLKNFGVDLRQIRNEIEKIELATAPDPIPLVKLPHTPRLKKAVQRSVEEARKLGHNYVGTEHLLLGLLREDVSDDGDTTNVATVIVKNLGVKLSDIRDEILSLIAPAVESPSANQQKAESFTIIKPGSTVFLPNGEIHNAVVTAVTLNANCMVRYNVAWWHDGTRHEQWLEACEVSAEPPCYVPVGFANGIPKAKIVKVEA